jgi:hypothetical protein
MIGGPHSSGQVLPFRDYQGVKQLIGVTRTSTIPPLAERARCVYRRLKYLRSGKHKWGQRYNCPHGIPDDVIDFRFDPAAQRLLARFPTPTNLTAKANNYTRTARDADHQKQFDLRIDGRAKP